MSLSNPGVGLTLYDKAPSVFSSPAGATWQDVDVSSHLTAGYVECHYKRSTSTFTMGLRADGSSVDTSAAVTTETDQMFYWGTIKVAGGLIEALGLGVGTYSIILGQYWA